MKGNPEQRIQVNAWYKANSGHTDIWKMYVRKVNGAFSINPPVAATLDDKDLTDILLESTFDIEPDDIDIDGYFYDYFPEVME